MKEKMSKEIIDGKIVDIGNMNLEELKALKEKLEAKEKKILEEIDRELGEE